jgi:hypothetical protein
LKGSFVFQENDSIILLRALSDLAVKYETRRKTSTKQNENQHNSIRSATLALSIFDNSSNVSKRYQDICFL